MSLRVFDFNANPSIDRPLYRVSNKVGQELMETSKAKLIDIAGRAALQMISPLRKPFGPGPLKCGQEAVYEAAGIERFPSFVQGGLTRTETQPNPKPSILVWGHLGPSKQTP